MTHLEEVSATFVPALKRLRGGDRARKCCRYTKVKRIGQIGELLVTRDVGGDALWRFTHLEGHLPFGSVDGIFTQFRHAGRIELTILASLAGSWI